MGNKKFDRIKKTLAVLLMLCFTLSITAVLAEAGDDSNGYNDGYNKGYSDGKIQGEKDCKQYGSRENLSKIPLPPVKNSWSVSYGDDYLKGHKEGYVDGYNRNRYICLK
jgi:hypothetical protein